LIVTKKSKKRVLIKNFKSKHALIKDRLTSIKFIFGVFYIPSSPSKWK